MIKVQKDFLTITSAGTKKVGREMAKKILKEGIKKTSCVLALEGDLGGGKTTFLQGFALGLGIKEKILSPTFVIMKRFQLGVKDFKNFYHLDCYRIKTAEDILDLDFKNILSQPENIIAIEWSELIKEVLPANAILIKFKFIDDKKRKIAVTI